MPDIEEAKYPIIIKIQVLNAEDYEALADAIDDANLVDTKILSVKDAKRVEYVE